MAQKAFPNYTNEDVENLLDDYADYCAEIWENTPAAPNKAAPEGPDPLGNFHGLPPLGSTLAAGTSGTSASWGEQTQEEALTKIPENVHQMILTVGTTSLEIVGAVMDAQTVAELAKLGFSLVRTAAGKYALRKATAKAEEGAALKLLEGRTKTVINNCFPAGTLVSTRAALRPIETIQKDEFVWAYDLIKSQWRLCRVNNAGSLPYKGTFVSVTVGKETIRSTYQHPYWVVRGEALASQPWLEHLEAIPEEASTPGRWVDSCDLRVGDEVLLRDGRIVRVETLCHAPFEGMVYNMEVDELHCYSVGRCGILVHNISGLGNIGSHGTVDASTALSNAQKMAGVRIHGDRARCVSLCRRTSTIQDDEC